MNLVRALARNHGPALPLLLFFLFLIFPIPKVTAQPVPLVPHGSIYIASNQDFLNPANGVVGGTGTPADPYVISGWQIQTDVPGPGSVFRDYTGITVMHVTSSFMIRHNTISAGFLQGIFFDDVIDARIVDLQVASPRGEGILSTGATSITLSGVSIQQPVSAGISLSGGASATIERTSIERKDAIFGLAVENYSSLTVSDSKFTDVDTSTYPHGDALLVTNVGAASIRGFSTSGWGTAIRTDDSTHVTLSDLRLTGAKRGLIATRLESLTIERAWVNASESFSAQIQSVSNASIDGLHVDNSGGFGLDAWDLGTLEMRRSSVASAKDGVRLDAASIRVESTNITHSGATGILAHSNRGKLVLEGTTIANSGQSGGEFSGFYSVRLHGVSSTESGTSGYGFGLLILNVTDIAIQDSAVFSAASAGLVVAQSVQRFNATGLTSGDNGGAGVDVQVQPPTGETRISNGTALGNAGTGWRLEGGLCVIRDTTSNNNDVGFDFANLTSRSKIAASSAARNRVGLGLDGVNITLTDFEAAGNREAGLVVYGFGHHLVGVHAHDNGASGLQLVGAVGVIVENSTFTANHAAGLSEVPSGTHDSQGNVIRNNTFEKNKGGGLSLDASGGEVTANRFLENGGYGVWSARQADLTTVHDNVFRGNGLGDTFGNSSPPPAKNRGTPTPVAGLGALALLAAARETRRRLASNARMIP